MILTTVTSVLCRRKHWFHLIRLITSSTSCCPRMPLPTPTTLMTINCFGIVDSIARLSQWDDGSITCHADTTSTIVPAWTVVNRLIPFIFLRVSRRVFIPLVNNSLFWIVLLFLFSIKNISHYYIKLYYKQFFICILQTGASPSGLAPVFFKKRLFLTPTSCSLSIIFICYISMSPCLNYSYCMIFKIFLFFFTRNVF